MHPLERDLESVLFTREQIAHRVGELGRDITRDYAGKDFLLVGILKGGVVFLADLTRAIALPHELEFMGASSYSSGTATTGNVRITRDLDVDPCGRHVLLCEDIYDTGHTLRALHDLLEIRRPASIRTCAFLVKEKVHAFEIAIDYTGFTIPDEFVVGYGLDHAEKYRNLPSIGVLKRAIYSPSGI